MKKGGDFEEYVYQAIIRDGLRLIDKAEPPVRVHRHVGNGNYVCTFLPGGVLDFQGSYLGRHVEIEVKDIKGTRCTFSRHFKISQLKRIRDMVKDNALVGVIIRFRGAQAQDDMIWCIPGATIVEILDNGDKGVSAGSDILKEQALRIEYGKRGSIKATLDRTIKSIQLAISLDQP